MKPNAAFLSIMGLLLAGTTDLHDPVYTYSMPKVRHDKRSKKVKQTRGAQVSEKDYKKDTNGYKRINKIGRNSPCICGSKKKFKKCCGI